MIKRNKWKNKDTNSAAEEGQIDFILIDPSAPKFLELRKGTEIIPSWYKDIPSKTKLRENDTKEDLTIKRCIPVLDAFTTGYFLVTTEDYSFEYDPDNETSNIKGGNNVRHKAITMHPITQLGNMPFSPEFIKYAFKWGNQYLIKTPPGYSTLFTHPMNHSHLPFYTLSGVVDTDSYIMPVLFPFIMKNNFSGIIPAGTPVVQVIPFRRDDWKSAVYDNPGEKFLNNTKQYTNEYERERYDSSGSPLGGMYKRDYRKKKRYL